MIQLTAVAHRQFDWKSKQLTRNAWSVRHERGAFGFEERAQPTSCR
jgi:hypothetical protein